MNNKIYFVGMLYEYPDILLLMTRSFDLYILISPEHIVFGITFQELEQFINKELDINTLYIFKEIYKFNSSNNTISIIDNYKLPDRYKNITYDSNIADDGWLSVVINRFKHNQTNLFEFPS